MQENPEDEYAWVEDGPSVVAGRVADRDAHAAVVAKRTTETIMAAVAAGAGSSVRLLVALVPFALMSTDLPFPSQERLAVECGVTSRTIRRWTDELEQLKVLKVFRSKAKRLADGTYTRATNRYQLLNWRAESINKGAAARAKNGNAGPKKRRRKRRNSSGEPVAKPVAPRPALVDLSGDDGVLVLPDRETIGAVRAQLDEAVGVEVERRRVPFLSDRERMRARLAAAARGGFARGERGERGPTPTGHQCPQDLSTSELGGSSESDSAPQTSEKKVRPDGLRAAREALSGGEDQ